MGCRSSGERGALGFRSGYKVGGVLHSKCIFLAVSHTPGEAVRGLR